jgi:hypothetical protein
MKRYAIIADVKLWIEDFVDEDTGEVVSIERTEILGYHVEDFDLSENSDEAEIEIISIVINFNNTLKIGEKPRLFKFFISQKQYKRIVTSHYDNKVIKSIVRRIENKRIKELK